MVKENSEVTCSGKSQYTVKQRQCVVLCVRLCQSLPFTATAWQFNQQLYMYRLSIEFCSNSM